jgi:hypothetical protein
LAERLPILARSSPLPLISPMPADDFGRETLAAI